MCAFPVYRGENNMAVVTILFMLRNGRADSESASAWAPLWPWENHGCNYSTHRNYLFPDLEKSPSLPKLRLSLLQGGCGV